LADLTHQYSDYAEWQRQWFQGERLESQLSFWKKQLDNITTLNLPTDRPRQALKARRGARRYFELSDEISSELKKLSHQHGATLFMTVLAAFQTLLHRYSGQTDIVVGSPVAGRRHKDFEQLIGFFLNTLVLRLDLSSNPTFIETLRRAREVILQALSHQDLPFEKLVEKLEPVRDLTHNPLFQISFSFQNTPRVSPKLSDIVVEELEVDTGIARFDLHFFMEEVGGQLKGYCDFDTNLFQAATIERMLGHFEVLLEGIVADADQRIGQLPLLTEAEKQQLLVQWNDTKIDYSGDKCIQQLFEEQVEKTPNAIAVVFKDQQLSYKELNHRANRLAHTLISEGMQSGTAVGIYLDRSIELAVGLLAVLKAGGVYVPVDPSYPSERVTFILQDVQAAFVLTTKNLAPQLLFIGARTLTLDTEMPKLDRGDDSNPRLIIGSQSPAYILYTSGSTGTPKGVVMSHRALNNLISWQVHNFYGLPARTLQFAPLGFDVSIQEMFSTWCAGGSLYFIQNDLRQDGSSLLRFIDKQAIERIFLPFVALQHLAEIAVNEAFTPQSLREIVTAGEQLRLTKPLRLFLSRLENCRLHNQYGPTESHVVTEYTLNPLCQTEPDLPPIGRPIANTEIYILDPNLDPTPIGVAGELHIGGDGVARGYFNRPELTQEKFIANPFSTEPGARLYKTGDLGRYLPDGNIEFIGRMDDQVKIRGYRIEPGEVEAALGQHPLVQSSVVVVREDTPGDKRLVGYVVGHHKGDSLEAEEIRKYLKQKLPEYMIPSQFVLLDALPLTATGKIDRNALPAPDQDRPELGNIYQAPRTPMEETLAAIWSEVLKLDRVGIHDNFFELGGHSLLATQVVSRVREQFSTELPLRTLFESATVEGLAGAIMEQREEPSEQEEHVFFELESPPAEGAHCFVAEETRSTSAGKRHE
jgi:amino acid adenylation domain-containing protein